MGERWAWPGRALNTARAAGMTQTILDDQVLVITFYERPGLVAEGPVLMRVFPYGE